MGYGITVYANVGLSTQSDSDLNKFVESAEQWPEVRECHMMSGDMDFMLKIVAEDWDDYQRFLTQKLTKGDNVTHVKSSICIRTTKSNPGIPIDVD
jgi:DNA-binding Lrp family transcriptional regulator